MRLSRRMIPHAVLTPVAVATLSLAVLQPTGPGTGRPNARTQRGLSLRHAGRGRPRHLWRPFFLLVAEGQGRPPARDDRSRGRREGGSRRAAYERGRRGTGWPPDPTEQRRPVLV